MIALPDLLVMIVLAAFFGGILILILVLLALTGRSMINLPRKWGLRIKENRPRGVFPTLGRVVAPVFLELLVPFLVLVHIPGGAGFPVWRLMVMFHPELVYGLFLLSLLLLSKVLWRAVVVAKK